MSRLTRHKLLITAGQILLIWLLITGHRFRFDYCFSNEADVVPFAKQFVESDWLPNDWFLNQNIDYRLSFNVLFGPIFSWLDLEFGTYIGRLFIYILLAVGLYNFFQTFRLRLSLGLIALFFFLGHQSMIAGEWIISGVEAKTLSYLFILLALSSFYLKRYFSGFAYSGLAISFHPLVGFYAIFCMTGALIINRQPYWLEWRKIVRSSWVIMLTGIFGLFAVVKQMIPQGNVDFGKAWEIYVIYRNPHHLLPSYWGGNRWIVELFLAIMLFAVAYFLGRSRAVRFISAYALASISLFVMGLFVYALGEIHLLRFYWFRFPDVMIRFMGIFLVAFIVNDLVNGSFPLRMRLPAYWSKIKQPLKNAVSIVLLFGVTIIIVKVTQEFYTRYQNYENLDSKSRPMLEWIAKNTPKGAVFLVDPSIEEFYCYAQRAMFVSFKHTPSSASNILEWYKRITLANGNRDPQEVGFQSLDEIRTNFYALDEESIRQIAGLYGIDYYLGHPQQLLSLPQIYTTASYKLYKIDSED